MQTRSKIGRDRRIERIELRGIVAQCSRTNPV